MPTPQVAAWEQGTPEAATVVAAAALEDALGTNPPLPLDLGTIAASVVYDLIIEGAMVPCIPDVPPPIQQHDHP